MDYQPGHPHGFCSAILLGEAALCHKLNDRKGALAAIKREASSRAPREASAQQRSKTRLPLSSRAR